MNRIADLILIAWAICCVPLHGRSETPVESFDQIWRVARENIYPAIERIGITPDKQVPYPFEHSLGEDPQLKAELEYLGH